jgi:hypothetical protein
VLWFVGFGFWLWSSETNRHYEFYKGQLSTCYAISSMRQDDPQRNQSLENCTEKAATFLHHQMDEPPKPDIN